MNPLGRLYEVSGSTGTTRFLYDGDALVAEYATNGTMLRRMEKGWRDIRGEQLMRRINGSE